MGHFVKGQASFEESCPFFCIFTRRNFPPTTGITLTLFLRLLQQLTAAPLRTSLPTRNQQDAFDNDTANVFVHLCIMRKFAALLFLVASLIALNAGATVITSIS